MSLGSHFVSTFDFPTVLSTRHQRNTNALHLWIPGYTFSQTSYTGVTIPLRMHVQKCPIQRNARCVLPCARDFILVAYLPDICSVSCWSHNFLRVQCSTNFQVFTFFQILQLFILVTCVLLRLFFLFSFSLFCPCLYCKY